MPLPRVHRRGVIQLLALALFAWIAWTILHLPYYIPGDIFPYLTALSPEAVLESQQAGRPVSTSAWIDFLAIESTFPSDSNKPLLQQLSAGTSFNRLEWDAQNVHLRRTAVRRRAILYRYAYYEPFKYVFPVEGATWFTNTFGADREGGKRRHEGTDLFAPEGTPLVSVSDGKVEQLGWNRLGGERVGVRGDDGNYYYYAHLQKIAPTLTVGQRIKRGDSIGTMGHTGDALTTPDHLHFGIELPNGEWINPYSFLVVWQYYTAKH